MPYATKEGYRQWAEQRRLDREAALLEYMTSCATCGISDPDVLQFHHVQPNTKSISVRNYSLSWDAVLAEIDKCVVLCANCHTKVHKLCERFGIEFRGGVE